MDLHDRFAEWLADGADGEPSRDLALHASTCEGCLRAIAVVDSLQAIQVGAAELPPLRFSAEPPRPFRVARVAVGTLAVALLGVSVGIGASGILRPTPSTDGPAASTAERVLAGVPTAAATDRSASPSPRPSASASDTPEPSGPATATGTPDSTSAPAQPAPGTPAPGTPVPGTPAPGTPAPQPPPPTPTPTAAPSTPAPTAAPTTPPPTPTPTLEPTPTPAPDDCEDGIDNDDDRLIDLLDPGCVLSGNEPDA